MSVRILLRHAQTYHNIGESTDFDSDLTERGICQIEEGSLHVKEVMSYSNAIQKCDWRGFVSPYLRTLRTALPIFNRLNINMVVDSRVGEVPDKYQKELKKNPIPFRQDIFPNYDWSKFPQEGLCIANRTIEEYQDDLSSFVKDLPDFAVIITHMTTARDLAEILTGRDLKSFEVPNCSVTYIEDGELVFIGKR